VRLSLAADAAAFAAAGAPRTVLPMPNGACRAEHDWRYSNGIVVHNALQRLFSAWVEPPGPGQMLSHTCDLQIDLEYSSDGGATFAAVRAPAVLSMQVRHAREFQGRTTYETEMMQLSIAGGDLPGGVMIRESPTKASGGGVCMAAGGGGGGAGGGAAISSFFDIFTELSTDGGFSWLPATNGPSCTTLSRVAPLELYADNRMPPPEGRYGSPPAWAGPCANGCVISNLTLRAFTASASPPAPGDTISHTCGAQADMRLSQDGGLTFSDVSAPASVSMQITGRLGGDGVTEYYDTEMTQLNIVGGGLPSGVMIRESPTRHSFGRTTTSIAPDGGYQIDSFFDIFTEVSVDGGQNWRPAESGPDPVTLGGGAQPFQTPGAKWCQPPDTRPEFGMDINASKSTILADDFLCTTNGPITNIVVWGSWSNNVLPVGGATNLSFTLSIHADVPAGTGGTNWSRPGTVLWITNFLAGRFQATNAFDVYYEGWLSPSRTNYLYPGDWTCWRYSFPIDPAGAFVQTGSVRQPIVYWLDVRAYQMPGTANFGWKTTTNHWGDDAVWGTGSEPYQGPWYELRYPPQHPLAGQSVDLAFAILGGTTSAPPEPADFGDAPDSLQAPGYPTLLAHNGARHAIVGGAPYFADAAGGDAPDAEADGQPDATATGDDVDANGDDEDGVTIPVLQVGVAANITGFLAVGGWVDAWVDWNGDGDWNDAGENIYSGLVGAGAFGLPVIAPGPYVGQTFARFRVHTGAAALPVDGPANDGEVEDHLVTIESFPAPHAMKWRQPPDRAYGLNLASWTVTNPQYAVSSPELADDWWCDGRPIDGIRWWGSYLLYDGPTNTLQIPRPRAFRLTWYLDYPTNTDGWAFSRPGPLLRQVVVPLLPYQAPLAAADTVSEFYTCTVPLDFLGPDYAGKSEHTFEYNVVLGDPWMEKNTLARTSNPPYPWPCSSNVYWLGVEAVYDRPPESGTNLWGWDTTARRFNWNDDAAMRTNFPGGGATFWQELTYVPPLWPWQAAEQHPYLGSSVNMAFCLLSGVVGRRDTKWSQLPNMELGTDMPSWRFQTPEQFPGVPQALRADDFISDGRRITDIHWWGSYIGWRAQVNTNEFGGGMPAPTGVNRPLGFDLSWHTNDPALNMPGLLLTNVFVPIAYCHEMYYCTIPQLGNEQFYPFEHEYQYYVDLLDKRLNTLPWYEKTNGHYWLNIPAVFTNTFVPAYPGYPNPDAHEGWGWKIGVIEPNPLLWAPSVVSNYATAGWTQSVLPPWHQQKGMKHNLSFELTTDKPNTNATIVITSFQRDTNALATTVSLGTAGAGWQYLQSCTNSLTNAVWVAVETNAVPFPPPWTNIWLRPGAVFSNEFFRVIEQ
jgi:hypothetical protein